MKYFPIALENWAKLVLPIALITLPVLGHPAKQTEHFIRGEKNFLYGYPSHNKNKSVNVVVEIPAGSNAKWEVSKPHGDMTWEFRKGQPRVVKFLAYPANYGMVPRTLLPKEKGGDGDPIDVIVLGPAIPRGSVVETRIIGGFRFLDKGEVDDKLLAVQPKGMFDKVHSLSDLKEDFPGALELVRDWFIHYKGPGKMVYKGDVEYGKARKLVEEAAAAFEKGQKSRG